METRNLTCIVCPMGCSLSVTLDGKEVTDVKGNTCPRGAKYAVAECTAPVRTLTTTVKTSKPFVMLPVKSAAALPKEKVLDCMTEINKVTANLPIKLGDVIISDICGTGIDIVAAKNIEEV